MYNSFREFLNVLEREKELINIDKQVDKKFEIAAYVRKTLDIEGPAFIFNNVKDYEGWKVAGGVYATRKRMALALETEIDKVPEKFLQGLRNRIQPKLLNDGPCKETIITGNELNLLKFPIPWHSEKDGGPYITAAVQIAKDPDTGIRGLGIHRMQLKGKDKLGFWATATKRLGRFHLKCEDNNKPLEMAVLIGVDPYVELGSLAQIPHSEDKLDVAGGLKGKPIELVKCETIDVEVPAQTEIVIEGEVLPHIREAEGPFGEITGCYFGVREAPIFKAKAITMRNNPIYHTVLTGVDPTENHLLWWPARSADDVVLKAELKRIFPEIQEMNAWGLGTVISIKKRLEKEAVNILMEVLNRTTRSKFCIVVDEDIDIYNEKEIMWALNTRVQPHEDVYIFPIMVGGGLDPSAPLPRHTSKMGIDATIPLGQKEKFEKVIVPGVEKVKW